MSDSLYNLLAPYLNSGASTASASTAPPSSSVPAPHDAVTSSYLSRLQTLPLDSLTTTESDAIRQNSQSVVRSLEALSARSHKSIITSSTHLSNVRTQLLSIAADAAQLSSQIPRLDEEALSFAERFNKSNTENNQTLERRRKALLLSRNLDRLSDVLELPSLLSSAISTSTSTSSSTSAHGSTATNQNYASALDLNAHIRRLHTLYPDSRLVRNVNKQAEDEMLHMTTSLIASLRTQGLKLAAAMRTISWLRRIAPELKAGVGNGAKGSEGSLGGVFLVCRLANLMQMLSALEPLKELADHETQQLRDERVSEARGERRGDNRWSGGQQTERFLKRWIEIFREQSFAVISVFRSIFPQEGDVAGVDKEDPLQPLPSSLATFPHHLISMLLETLRQYLPNVKGKASRDSLLTQVLYCAGSLGRLGGDFSLVLSFLEDVTEDEEEEEWVAVVKKHRVLAGKLESMVGA